MPIRVDSTESVLAVLVVYEKNLDDVSCWHTLLKLLDNEDRLLKLDHILIYDNSKNPQNLFIPSPQFITYKHNPKNGGTAAAYSFAAGLANKLNINWLLLLDHDTRLPENYFSYAENTIKKYDEEKFIAALVPIVKHLDQVISPAKITSLGSVIPLAKTNGKKLPENITAISSGAFINSKALKEILPIPKELWLDYVDHWIFNKFYNLRYKILCFNSTIDHDLSIKSVKELTPLRIKSILDGEYMHVRGIGYRAKYFYPFRLAKRALIYYPTSKKNALTIIQWVLEKLFKTR